MAKMQGRQPAPVETEDMHTPPDPRAQALANAQAHGEDLRQRRQHQPPPASMHPRRNSEPNACNVAGVCLSSLAGHRRGRQRPPQFARTG
jgi:hypothetical protein